MWPNSLGAVEKLNHVNNQKVKTAAEAAALTDDYM